MADSVQWDHLNTDNCCRDMFAVTEEVHMCVCCSEV